MEQDTSAAPVGPKHNGLKLHLRLLFGEVLKGTCQAKTRIVNQHVDAPLPVNDRLNRLLYFFLYGNIHLQHLNPFRFKTRPAATAINHMALTAEGLSHGLTKS